MKELKDVSVFLNLTGIAFEKTDPLMSLVNVNKPLLFYDRLSVARFPIGVDEREEHIDELLSSMKNMLECRTLSTNDYNEKIRLIVAIDMSTQLFVEDDATEELFRFPAQNVRWLKKKITEVFSKNPLEEGSLLSNRFYFNFIFIDSNKIGQDNSNLFWNAAYNGYSNVGLDGWVSNHFDLDDLKEEAREKMKKALEAKGETYDSKKRLDNDDIKAIFDSFITEVKEKVSDTITIHLAKVGLKTEFDTAFQDRLNELRTVNDFEKFDFDQEALSVVTQKVGLCSEEFRDCTFFFVKLFLNPDAEKTKGETFVKSLVQLLCTIDDKEYITRFRPTPSMNYPYCFTLDQGKQTAKEVNLEDLLFMRQCIDECQKKLSYIKWNEDKTVEYMEYSQHPTQSNLEKINDKLDPIRIQKYKEFVEVRRPAFFFGKKLGDWSWYKEVLEKMDSYFKFEEENDRPLYDPPKRISDKEMDGNKRTKTYRELKLEKQKLLKTSNEIVKVEDLSDYLHYRHDMMDQLGAAIEQLKKEMLKLGFLARLLPIAIISTLVFVLSFAYHYFYNGFVDRPIWILACLGAVSLLSILAALVARIAVGSKIRSAHDAIDDITHEMDKRREKFLKDVAQRVLEQNKADVKSRNLKEIQSKLDEFEVHNMQVENIWNGYFSGMKSKLTQIINVFPEAKSMAPKKAVSVETTDFSLDGFPRVPYKIRKEFEAKDTKILADAKISDVTCLVSHFNFLRLPS